MAEKVLYEHHKIIVDPKQSYLRIDKYLSSKLPATSRTKIQQIVQAGYVWVNGKTTKANYKIRPHDELIVALDTPVLIPPDIIPEDIAINIIYEDEELLVVDKPSGMVVHPGYSNWTGTLVHALLYKFGQLPSNSNGKDKPGLVHRIDKNTSGLLVVAKTNWAMNYLAKQFAAHSIQRSYYALVWGEPIENKGTVKANIGRSYADRRVYTVFEDRGKNAVTHYEVIERLRYVSLLKCHLETGRTHQIRVHMKHIGHTLFNDNSYGGDKILKGHKFSKYKSFVENCFNIIPRQALHAKSLGFIHPATNKYMQFESNLPKDFQRVLEKWKRYVQCN